MLWFWRLVSYSAQHGTALRFADLSNPESTPEEWSAVCVRKGYVTLVPARHSQWRWIAPNHRRNIFRWTDWVDMNRLRQMIIRQFWKQDLVFSTPLLGSIPVPCIISQNGFAEAIECSLDAANIFLRPRHSIHPFPAFSAWLEGDTLLSWCWLIRIRKVKCQFPRKNQKNILDCTARNLYKIVQIR